MPAPRVALDFETRVLATRSALPSVAIDRFAFRFFDWRAEIDLPQQRAYKLLRALDKSHKNTSAVGEARPRVVLSGSGLAISIFVDRARSVSVSEEEA